MKDIALHIQDNKVIEMNNIDLLLEHIEELKQLVEKNKDKLKGITEGNLSFVSIEINNIISIIEDLMSD